MKITPFIAGAALLPAAIGCASSHAPGPVAAFAGGSEQLEAGQVQVESPEIGLEYGQTTLPDYGRILSDPGPF